MTERSRPYQCRLWQHPGIKMQNLLNTPHTNSRDKADRTPKEAVVLIATLLGSVLPKLIVKTVEADNGLPRSAMQAVLRNPCCGSRSRHGTTLPSPESGKYHFLGRSSRPVSARQVIVRTLSAGIKNVARAGIEPATPGFSVLCSTN